MNFPRPFKRFELSLLGVVTILSSALTLLVQGISLSERSNVFHPYNHRRQFRGPNPGEANLPLPAPIQIVPSNVNIPSFHKQPINGKNLGDFVQLVGVNDQRAHSNGDGLIQVVSVGSKVGGAEAQVQIPVVNGPSLGTSSEVRPAQIGSGRSRAQGPKRLPYNRPYFASPGVVDQSGNEPLHTLDELHGRESHQVQYFVGKKAEEMKMAASEQKAVHINPQIGIKIAGKSGVVNAGNPIPYGVPTSTSSNLRNHINPQSSVSEKRPRIIEDNNHQNLGEQFPSNQRLPQAITQVTLSEDETANSWVPSHKQQMNNHHEDKILREQTGTPQTITVNPIKEHMTDPIQAVLIHGQVPQIIFDENGNRKYFPPKIQNNPTITKLDQTTEDNFAISWFQGQVPPLAYPSGFLPEYISGQNSKEESSTTEYTSHEITVPIKEYPNIIASSKVQYHFAETKDEEPESQETQIKSNDAEKSKEMSKDKDDSTKPVSIVNEQSGVKNNFISIFTERGKTSPKPPSITRQPASLVSIDELLALAGLGESTSAPDHSFLANGKKSPFDVNDQKNADHDSQHKTLQSTDQTKHQVPDVQRQDHFFLSETPARMESSSIEDYQENPVDYHELQAQPTQQLNWVKCPEGEFNDVLTINPDADIFIGKNLYKYLSS